jgi:hypothetical protein
MDFKILRGKKILVEKPVAPESAVILTDEAKASQEQELMKRWSKLRVAAIGDEVTGVKVDDSVYVGNALAHSEILEIDGKHYFLVPEASVVIIW